MQALNRLVVKTLPLVPRGIVGKVAARYVSGATFAEAAQVIHRLNREGAMATVDVLGEEVRTTAPAIAATDEYLRALQAIHEQQLLCNISVKPTQLGLKVAEDFCRDNLLRLLELAASQGNFLRLDMEDHTCTDATLRLYRDLHQRHGDRVGVVLQAYLRRTLDDIAALPADAVNVRLCKGIYVEPREVAWQDRETIRLNFLAALERLFDRGIYVGIATHDEYLVSGALALIHRLKIPRERYEFQMLLGVETRLRKILLAAGHRLRVYVPFGREWYSYSVRRLRENPALAGHVLRAFLRRETRDGQP